MGESTPACKWGWSQMAGQPWEPPPPQYRPNHRGPARAGEGSTGFCPVCVGAEQHSGSGGGILARLGWVCGGGGGLVTASVTGGAICVTGRWGGT